MNTIVLQYPEQLWVLPIALAVVLLVRAVRRRPFAAFPLAALLVPARYRASRLRHVPTFVAAAALPLIAVALTEPVLPYAQGQMTSRGLDIVLVLDLSLSMQELMGQPGVMPPMARATTATTDYSQYSDQRRSSTAPTGWRRIRRHAPPRPVAPRTAKRARLESSGAAGRTHPGDAPGNDEESVDRVHRAPARRSDRPGRVLGALVLDQSDDVRSRVLDAVRGARRRQDPAGRSDDGHRRRHHARQQPARAPVEKPGVWQSGHRRVHRRRKQLRGGSASRRSKPPTRRAPECTSSRSICRR